MEILGHGIFWQENVGLLCWTSIGFQQDPLPVDLLKILVDLRRRETYLSSSKHRFAVLKDRFLEGFGTLPRIPSALALLCEVMHRISSLAGYIDSKQSWLRRCLLPKRWYQSNVKWLLLDSEKSMLWPRI